MKKQPPTRLDALRAAIPDNLFNWKRTAWSDLVRAVELPKQKLSCVVELQRVSIRSGSNPSDLPSYLRQLLLLQGTFDEGQFACMFSAVALAAGGSSDLWRLARRLCSCEEACGCVQCTSTFLFASVFTVGVCWGWVDTLCAQFQVLAPTQTSVVLPSVCHKQLHWWQWTLSSQKETSFPRSAFFQLSFFPTERFLLWNLNDSRFTKALLSPHYTFWQPRGSLTYPVSLHTPKSLAKCYCELSQISLTYTHTHTQMKAKSNEGNNINHETFSFFQENFDRKASSVFQLKFLEFPIFTQVFLLYLKHLMIVFFPEHARPKNLSLSSHEKGHKCLISSLVFIYFIVCVSFKCCPVPEKMSFGFL